MADHTAIMDFEGSDQFPSWVASPSDPDWNHYKDKFPSDGLPSNTTWNGATYHFMVATTAAGHNSATAMKIDNYDPALGGMGDPGHYSEGGIIIDLGAEYSLDSIGLWGYAQDISYPWNLIGATAQYHFYDINWVHQGAESTSLDQDSGGTWTNPPPRPINSSWPIRYILVRLELDMYMTHKTTDFRVDQIAITGELPPPPGIAPADHKPGACGQGCPFEHASSSTEHCSGNPINMRAGNKELVQADFNVQTPAGLLAFTRSYLQDRQDDPDFQFMGLGWTHNHIFKLSLSGTSPNREADILLPGGLVLKLAEDSANPGHFDAAPGSTSELDYDGGNQEYILTAQDKSTYHFDDTSFLLKTRTWPSDETWTYTHSSSALTEIDDGYGRKLKFSYISNPSGFDDGQLWRVGDHTASGLDTGSPSGRFIELDYTEEHVNGSPVTPSPKALLTDVHDVLGQTWTYTYFGQAVGETDTDQLNFLVQRASPSVDTGGDGTVDNAIVQESLVYTLSSGVISTINQQRGDGLLETDFAFQPGGEIYTTETIAGRVATHHFADNNGSSGVYVGTNNPNGDGGNQDLAASYRPSQKVDANGTATTLEWSATGKFLDAVTDALSNITQFNYDSSDRLDYSLDAEGRKTAYTYGDVNNERLPTQVDVYDDAAGTTLLQRQQFTYDSQGRVLTEKTIDPSDGTTELRRTERTYYTTGDGAGLLEKVTQKDLVTPANDMTTTYFYDELGRTVQVNQSSTFGSCTKSYTIYDAAGHVVASICNFDISHDPTNPLADADDAIALRQDTTDPNANRVTVHEYDTLGRRFKTITEAGTGEARASLTVYDSLNRVVRSIANYVADAAVPNPFTADRDDFDHGVDGTHNRISETVFDDRGLVVQQIDPPGNVTLIGYDDAGRQVRVVRNASQPDYNSAADPELADYLPVADADMDIITSSGYDANGNLVKSIDVNGNVTFTVYDALNRVIQTVRNAKAEATVELEPGDPGYSAGNDPRTMLYAASDAPDTDLITRTEYDAMSRVVRSWDVLDNVTLTGYDALGRQVKTIRSASQPNYDLVADPDLSAYSPALNADLDIISETTYDEAGQVLYTEDVNANKARLVYDGLGRQVRSIQNWVDNSVDPADWVWDAVDSRWEDGAGNPINHGDADQNIIAHTHFDSDGRVAWTQDVLNRLTRHVYDDMGRRVRSIQNWIDNSVDPADWVWDDDDEQWEDGSGNAIDLGTNFDQNLISDTVYDDSGRVAYTRDSRGNETHNIYDEAGRRIQTITNYGDGVFDPATPDEDLVQTTVYDGDGRVLKTVTVTGIATRFVYDRLGRRTQTIANFVDGQFNPDRPDEDLTSTTVYNKAGQVVASIDARGTETHFTYDAAGRRLTITQAAATDLATTSYTCYDKAGRTLRVIRNWIDNGLSPDALDASGNWLFAPSEHGPHNDRNLISSFQLDKLGRVVSTTDVLGNVSSISFAKDGRALAATNPAGVASANRYDGLRRLVRVVQNHVTNGVDPADWIWNTNQWEDGSSNPIAFGTDNDQNIIVDVELDLVGRRAALRDPRGNRTTYAYDALNRRTGLTDPLSHTWSTAHALLSGGGSRVTVSDPLGHDTQQDFDRLGRLAEIAYLSESPKLTPDVRLAYDGAGNRVAMTESVDGWNTLERGTGYRYDAARRLVGVDVDRDGDGAAEETVEYEYDAGGLRTRLVLPDGKALVYTYDERGQLRALSDWDNQVVSYRYDEAGRRVSTIRADAFQTLQDYDAAGRLTQLEHRAEGVTLGRFAYTLDALGNRAYSTDAIRRPDNAPNIVGTRSMDYHGNWTDNITEDFDASLEIYFYGEAPTLKLGTDVDRSICDIYVDNVFWSSLDTYAATPGELAVTIPLARLNWHSLEIRNRPERNKATVPTSPTSFKLEFVQLETAYDVRRINYDHDDLSRLVRANYFEISNGIFALSPTRVHEFTYDVAGNRTSDLVAVISEPEADVTTYTYDAANRISSAGFAYNDAGQMTADGTLSYSWDRAGRLLGAGDSSYAYNGLGQRVQQTVSGVVTEYLLDVQPGLAKVIAATTGANTERFVHERGLLSQQDSAGDWQWMVADGLGSVRGVVDGAGFDPAYSVHYAPYGQPWGEQGPEQTPFGFTGEPTDDNGLVHLRARYYNPALGVFPSLDPVEGVLQQAMSLNRYAYVAGNVVNAVDPSGAIYERPYWNRCSQQSQCSQCANILSTSGFNNEIIIREYANCISTHCGYYERLPERAACIQECRRFEGAFLGGPRGEACRQWCNITTDNNNYYWGETEDLDDPRDNDAALRATVIIVAGRFGGRGLLRADCNSENLHLCERRPGLEAALGTIDGDSIWTHSHYLGRAIPELALNERGQRSALKGYDYLEIIGYKRREILEMSRVSDSNIVLRNAGTIRIHQLSQAGFSTSRVGSPLQTHQLDTRAYVDNSVSSGGVRIAYYPGIMPLSDLHWRDLRITHPHAVLTGSIGVNVDVGRSVGRRVPRQWRMYLFNNNPRIVSPGSSGGGVFTGDKVNPTLIGTTQFGIYGTDLAGFSGLS